VRQANGACLFLWQYKEASGDERPTGHAQRLQVLERQRREAAGRKEKISVDEVRLLWQEIRLLART
jgi:hypothetical protein